MAALTLAGCGGGGSHTASTTRTTSAPPPPSPFKDPHVPLNTFGQLLSSNKQLSVRAIVFAAGGGKSVGGYLASTTKPGKHPAVLFMHGSGGTASDLLAWASQFAADGGVAISIQAPDNVTGYKELVVDARRALDLLDSRPNVDPSRIGVFGFSQGGQTAAILAGVDPRPTAVALMSVRGTATVLHWVRYAHAHFSIMAGRRDQIVPQRDLKALIAAVPQPKQVRWYDAPHTLTLGAVRTQLAWLESQLDVQR